MQDLHATMMHVPGDEILVGILADLPADQQDQLRSSERKLVEYLANRAHSEERAEN
jgi:hypothetical protein